MQYMAHAYMAISPTCRGWVENILSCIKVICSYRLLNYLNILAPLSVIWCIFMSTHGYNILLLVFLNCTDMENHCGYVNSCLCLHTIYLTGTYFQRLVTFSSVFFIIWLLSHYCLDINILSWNRVINWIFILSKAIIFFKKTLPPTSLLSFIFMIFVSREDTYISFIPLQEPPRKLFGLMSWENWHLHFFSPLHILI